MSNGRIELMMLLVLAGAELRPLRGSLERQVVDGERHLPRELVDVGGVVGDGVVAALLGPPPGLHLALAPVLRLGTGVDHQVGQVDAEDVLRHELLLEPAEREQPALGGELADLLDRLVLGQPERQYGVRDGAVGDLLVDVQRVAAPVAARVERVGGVDDHLRAARLALEGQLVGDVGLDVLRPAGDDRALELVDALAEAELLLDAVLLPLVPAEQADQLPGRAAQPDVGRPALGAAVEPVAQRLVDGVDVRAGLGLRPGRGQLLPPATAEGCRTPGPSDPRDPASCQSPSAFALAAS
ncbi:hypothetical protein [Nocardioides sp. TF02-7]|uniref:hypothetical protein n=1 Tax=Nocardioides sp. TF02-7 TaxID=2917724 RepID=UPI001F0540ED|nr:hypothetical protein [Nocardioides sp. TF02-7]UMG93019.1 hypothetical protein MF408_01290 [Nocardioides sp. TF02-7]